jgi:hypothetical protein
VSSPHKLSASQPLSPETAAVANASSSAARPSSIFSGKRQRLGQQPWVPPTVSGTTYNTNFFSGRVYDPQAAYTRGKPGF